VLSVDVTYFEWTFTVADDFPPTWNLYQSADGGVTWTGIDSNPYGTDSFMSLPSSSWVKATRADGGGIPYGPDSNIIIVP
jgi:hypothetical protein